MKIISIIKKIKKKYEKIVIPIPYHCPSITPCTQDSVLGITLRRFTIYTPTVLPGQPTNLVIMFYGLCANGPTIRPPTTQ